MYLVSVYLYGSKPSDKTLNPTRVAPIVGAWNVWELQAESASGLKPMVEGLRLGV